MKKTYLYIERSIFRSLDQAFGLHFPGLGPVLRLAVAPRRERSPVKALAIFYRRRAVGIEHIALIKDRIGNFFYELYIHTLKKAEK